LIWRCIRVRVLRLCRCGRFRRSRFRGGGFCGDPLYRLVENTKYLCTRVLRQRFDQLAAP
jgi:hypothetical protein